MSGVSAVADPLLALEETSPLVNAITNDVTVNEVANVILHWGALPVMSDDDRELDEMIGTADAVLLNMGTVDEAGMETMLTAGRAAADHDAPLVVDPVGAGATSTRSAIADRLLTDLSVDVLNGNHGEIAAIAGDDARVRGVESVGDHADIAEKAMAVARERDVVVVASGPTDIVADAETAYEISVGDPMMGNVVGTGCMLGGSLAAFLGATDDVTTAAIAATLGFGLAGEAAAAGEYGRVEGPASYEIAFRDAVAGLSPDTVSAAEDRIEAALTEVA